MKEKNPSWHKIPIATIKIHDLLLVPIQIELDDRTVEELQDYLLKKIKDLKSKVLIIDVSAIELIDSYIAKVLVETAEMAYLLGTKTILVGIKPDIALTLSQMGMKINLETALSLEKALHKLGFTFKREGKNNS